MIKTFGPPWVRRAFLALISFLIVMLGVGTLFHGKIEYYNWWGGRFRQLRFPSTQS
jgi:hypothetical protein